MFSGLSDRLQATLDKVRGQGTLSESNIKEALREVRLALLEADVNLKIVKDFINLTDFMTWFIINYPRSVSVMKTNSAYQDRFK